MYYKFKLAPEGRLFFGDGRQMQGSVAGTGAGWPMPHLFYHALISAFYDKWPQMQPFEQEHKNKNKRDTNWDKSRMRFGGLKTAGIFAELNGRVYLPVPGDIEPNEGKLDIIRPSGISDLPAPLKYMCAASEAPSKETAGNWISLEGLKKYLSGEKAPKTEFLNDSDIFTVESAPGVGINPDTRSNEKSKFYQADYMRLNRSGSAGMFAFAKCIAKKFNGEETDLIAKLGEEQNMILGGQRQLVNAEIAKSGENFLTELSECKIEGNRMKWVLLAPGLFKNGWLPDFIDKNSGKVKLKPRPVREKGMKRSDWWEMVQKAPEIDAHLVAAKTGKPFIYSGWSLDKNSDNAGGAPKAAKKYVPAGAVYYFECADNAEALKLAKELHLQIKNTKGFAFGVCAPWELKQ